MGRVGVGVGAKHTLVIFFNTGGEYCVGLDFVPSYNGTVSSTLNGLTCQRWDSQHPHQHQYTDHNLFPEATLEDAGNYCRTPDGSEWPWCFTTSLEVRSQLCYFGVKLCASGEPSGTSWDFDEQCHLEDTRLCV